MEESLKLQKFITNSPEETEELASRFAKTLKGSEVIAMFGDLGAGKTAFARGLAAGLESDDDVSSPTFALVNEYSGRCKIYHFDMYRIGSEEDLFSTGFYDYEGNGVMLIEWSENIRDYLPENRITITIRTLGEMTREFTFEGAEEI